MSSNDEHAQSGDTIEITTHLRNDLGKRMQVSTSDGLSVIAMDNRMRVTVAHGDYKIVKRCGRPATADAPRKRGPGRPSNAEIAARAQTPAAVEMPKAKVEPRVSLVTKVEGTDDKAIVTDADVAGLEAALAPKVVTNPLGQSVTVIETADGVTSCECGEPAHVAHFHSDPEQTARNEQDRALDERAESAWHAHRLEQEVSIDIKPLTVTQEQLDAMTRQYDQHDHMVDAVKYGISMTRVEPRSFVPDEYPHADKPDDRKHSHYFKTVPCNQIDVYRVLAAFNVADPCIQHAVKKLLVAGGRGSKDISRDVGEAIDTLQRWQEMRAEEVA